MLVTRKKTRLHAVRAQDGKSHLVVVKVAVVESY